MLETRPSGLIAPAPAPEGRWIAAIDLPADLLNRVSAASKRMGANVQALSRDWIQPNPVEGPTRHGTHTTLAGTCSIALLATSVLTESFLAQLSELRRRAITTIAIGPRFGTEGHRRALAAGADEVWPSGLDSELIGALLRATLRRCQPPSPTTASLSLRIESGSRACVISGRSVRLNQGQCRLLQALASAFPGAIARQELMQSIGQSRISEPDSSRALDMRVSKLRQRLRDERIPDLEIEAVRGHGYRLRLMTAFTPVTH